ncbi:MAG: hypothetical protein ABI422_00670 [Sphingomicrobium sp.]
MTILAMGLMVVAAPVFAKGESANPSAASSNSAKAAGTQDKKYCIQYDDIVGSRIRGKMECKTKADWAREGIDVARPTKG